MKHRTGCVVVGFLWLVLSLAAQTSGSNPASAQVPPLIQFSNVAADENGNSMSGVVNITFSLYTAQQGGEPLWTETQNNVQLDSTGHYSVQLGITKRNGVPTVLFTTAEARWLGVRIAEQAEQPRVLLLSVPYAMKAGDAATIGGLPPSAFVLAAPLSGAASATIAETGTGQGGPPPSGDVTGTGTINYLPLWDSTSDITSSVLFQKGTGSTAKIGINTITPATTLDVKGGGTIRGTLSLPATGAATDTAGKNSQPLNLAASAFNSTSNKAVNQTFQWLAEPASNDTSTPSGTLDLLFGEGTTKPSATGLSIANNGRITFATGQTFPGTGDGTITGVTAGTDLTGGGTTGTVTLNLDTTKVPLLGAANTFTGNQTVNGNLQVSSNGIGVAGSATATSGFSVGVGGTAVSPGGYGVEGVNTGSGGVGVYGYDSGGTGVSGYGVTGVSGSGTAYGVQATATGGGSTGVYGTAPQFGLYGVATGSSGSTVGVYGNGVDGLQGSGTLHGVYAAGTGASSYGVYATSPSLGVYAAGTGTSATGAYGTTASTTGYGVEGVNTSASGTGVYGTAAHFGVWGVGGSNGVYGVGTEWGVYGTATDTSGTAVGVYGNGVDGLQGSGTAYGVYSYTPNKGVAGTYGVYQGASATGQTWIGTTGTGGTVWADTNYDSEANEFYIPALLVTADANYAGAFNNNSSYSPTISAYNYGTGGTGEVLRAEGAGGSCTLTGSGDTACTGALKSVVATTSSAGARRVETYSMQSPENWFEDFGSGALSNGAATVRLDPTFTQTVNTGIEYHVFLTPNGDSKGLYVSQKTATSFEVREQGGGTSSIGFDYRIVAKRVGYEKVRLADVTERFNQQEARSAKMHSARSSAGPRSIPEMTMPTAHSLAEQHPTPHMLVPPVLPSAAPRPGLVTPKPPLVPPARATLRPVETQRK